MSKNNNEIKNYEVRFCSCGRIHFLNRDEIYKTIDNNRETLLICAGCGAATRVGADDYFDGGKAMYSIELKKNTEITEDNFNKKFKQKEGSYIPIFDRIIYSEGKRVPLKTGYYATHHINKTWYDEREMIDFEDQLDAYKSMEEFKKAFHDYRVKARTVNVERLLDELSDSERKALEGYMYLFEKEESSYEC